MPERKRVPRERVIALWPELAWIQNEDLRERVTQVWVTALEESALAADDLERIPFTLLAKDCTVSFMAHKRSVVHICRSAAETMKTFYGDALPIDMDTLIAGAILIDVGKLLEYELKDGKAGVSKTGRYLRHPFTGVALAQRHGLPDEVCHLIATHAKEGNLGKRSVEATIAHHADFLTFEPFVERL
jgi:putative nucleotidyltransferase with HDIG domain